MARSSWRSGRPIAQREHEDGDQRQRQQQRRLPEQPRCVPARAARAAPRPRASICALLCCAIALGQRRELRRSARQDRVRRPAAWAAGVASRRCAISLLQLAANSSSVRARLRRRAAVQLRSRVARQALVLVCGTARAASRRRAPRRGAPCARARRSAANSAWRGARVRHPLDHDLLAGVARSRICRTAVNNGDQQRHGDQRQAQQHQATQ